MGARAGDGTATGSAGTGAPVARPQAAAAPGAAAPAGTSLTARLRARPPGLHAGGSESWGLAWPALSWLEREVHPGMATLETGSGASTIVFAARGARHEAVTPDPGEEQRIRAACAGLGIDAGGVRFRIGPSHEVLARLPWRPLDLALVDGAHGFPYPVLDWWAIAPRLRVGGRLLLDDAYMPPVAMILDGLRGDPSWRVEETVGYRTVVLRRVGDGLPPFDWDGRRVGGAMSFGYLPPRRRAVASARHRFFSTPLGLRLVELARRDAGLRFRKTG